MPDFTVLTGGPGSGKTTLTDALRAAGLRASAGAGRQIIQEQMSVPGQGLPWLDRALFAELMLSREMATYRAFAAEPPDGPVFFDRGVPTSSATRAWRACLCPRTC